MKTPSLQSQKKISSFAQSLCSVWNVSTYWRVRRLCALFLLLPEASEKKKNLHIYFLNHILMVQNPFVIWRKNPTFRNCQFFSWKFFSYLGFFVMAKQTLRFDGKTQLLEFDNFSRENSLVIFNSNQTLRFDGKIHFSQIDNFSRENSGSRVTL